MKRLYLLTAVFFMFALEASAQKVSIQTNILDWAAIGTMNAEANVSIAQHFSLSLGGRYNPFTIGADREVPLKLQQRNVYAGARYWPWYVNSGWWFAAKVQYIDYCRSGILTKGSITGQNGRGAGLSAGYAFMLAPHFNLELGAGACVNRYERYIADIPGVEPMTDMIGTQTFLEPDFLSFALVFVF